MVHQGVRRVMHPGMGMMMGGGMVLHGGAMFNGAMMSGLGP